MLKKILAASSAAVIAVSALASTAMAADEGTIVITADKKTAEFTTATLKGTISGANLAKLYTDNASLTATQNWDEFVDNKNSYSNTMVAVWVAPTVPDGNGGTTAPNAKVPTGLSTGDTDFGKQYVTIDSGKFTVDLNGTVQKYEKIPATDPDYDPNLAQYRPVANGTSADTVSANNTIKNTGLVATTNTQDGFATTPTNVVSTFGLNPEKGLQSINFEKSSVTAEFTVTVYNKTWEKMAQEVNNGVAWNWGNEGFNAASLEQMLKGEVGKALIARYFGITAESGLYDSKATAGAQWTRKGGVGAKDVPLEQIGDTKSSSVEKEGALPLPAGTIPIGVGQNATIPTLKKLNNGGTITFEFSKELNSQIVVGTVQSFSTNGQVALPLDSDFAYDEGAKSLTMKFGPGYTFDPDNGNQFNSFKIMYNFVMDTVTGVVGDTVGNTDYTGSKKYDGKLVKITIKANDKAPAKDPTSSSTTSDGGLVSSSTTSSSTPSSSATNSGSNNNEKNPGTGVAVAVAPVVLAAAGAAVVISKKRK